MVHWMNDADTAANSTDSTKSHLPLIASGFESNVIRKNLIGQSKEIRETKGLLDIQHRLDCAIKTHIEAITSEKI